MRKARFACGEGYKKHKNRILEFQMLYRFIILKSTKMGTQI